MSNVNVSAFEDLDLAFMYIKEIEYIDLSWNKLTIVKRSYFNFHNLQFLNLSHNMISFLEEGCLVKLTNMTYLDLSYNKLKNINSNTFSVVNLILTENLFENLTGLTLSPLYMNNLILSDNRLIEFPFKLVENTRQVAKDLDLSNNRIMSLGNIGFSKVSQAYTLIIKRNFIDSISSDFFKYLRYSTSLDLSINAISTLHEQTFSHLSFLRYLNLSGNSLSYMNKEMCEGLDNLV